MTASRRRVAAILGMAALMWSVSSARANAATVSLPIEVVGGNGTIGSVTVDVPAGRARDIRSLWMQIHGLAYDGMISVQVNGTAWFSLNNATVDVAEPGRSYGGIGGGFSTLSVTLTLPADAVVDGANTLRFRFNRTDGVASGFRVVALNFLTSGSSRILERSAFTEEDPSTWVPPLSDSSALLAGKQLWMNAELMANSLPNAPRIRARCADCHAYDGRDLKYFGYSNASIIARSRFHGLSELQARQIASYIRSLPVTSPGRPWNPPYQPGPGLEEQPVANWAAGAGLSWALESDAAALSFIFERSSNPAERAARAPAQGALNWDALVPLITRSAFRPDGNLNPREIPISLQLPDWNHWLPRIHPLDAWGQAFQNSQFAELYGAVPADASSGERPSSSKSRQRLRGVLASPDLGALISSGRIVAYFENWTNARRALLRPYVEGKGVKWSSDLATKAYATQLWQLVKAWEMTQEFGLEGRGRELFGPTGETRTWFNSIPASTAPAAVNIPDGPSGMGGSALTNEYFDACWYQLQVLLNGGNHRHRGRTPVDWVYVVGQFQNLYEQTRRPEPARLLVTLIKAMQSTDPGIGPDDVSQGWRPSQNVDPTIMVSAVWSSMFEPLPEAVRRAVTESYLGAWLDKNAQYPIGQYFRVGLTEVNYQFPESYGEIAGGNILDAAGLFARTGVSPELMARLRKWGSSYAETAARFQYSPGGSARNRRPNPRKTGGS